MFGIKTFSTLLMLAAAAVAAPVVSKRSGGKKGLAFNDDQQSVGLAKQFTSAKSWGYNWEMTSTAADSVGINEFVPMCWGNGQGPTQNMEACKSEIPKAIARGCKHVLGFNEPDHETQSNMPVDTAVANWGDVMQPFAGKIYLGAPAVTSRDEPGRGLNYLEEFLGKAKGNGYTVDFVPLHYYNYDGSVQDASVFGGFVERAFQIVKKSYPGATIWVTEFGSFLGDEGQNERWLADAMRILDGASYVERYSAFGTLVPQGPGYLTDGQSLNKLGYTYNS